MITRRCFLARGLRDSSLIALAPTLPGFLARHGARRRSREGWPHPGRRAARRRQRRHQHGRPVQGRRVRQAPQGDPAAREAADQGQRRGRPAPGDGRRGEAAGIGPAGDRAGRGLSEPEPLALPQHGDLAIGPARRARHNGLGWVGRGLDERPDDPRRRPGGAADRARRPAAGHPRPAIRQRRARPPRRLCPDRQGGRARPIGSSAGRGRPGAVPAPQPAGRLHHGGPPRGRRRGPRRPCAPIPSRSWPGGCS